jgi:transposase-like protein
MLSRDFSNRERATGIAVDETKMKVDGKEVYVWAAVDVETFTNRRFVSHQTAERFETFEIVHVDVSPGRFSLDAFSFSKPL